MEFEVSYSLDNEQQFWDELDDIVAVQCETYEAIDNSLRAYLSFTSNYKCEYLQNEYAIARCSYKLLESSIFIAHKSYVRRQLIYSILQEDALATLHLIAAFLRFDGRQDEETFKMMNEEGVFPRLVELIQGAGGKDASLHRMLLELLYEMSRLHQLRSQDLIVIDDEFVIYLLQMIEALSDDVNDPYHYPVIRVLLVLNEQYMISAHPPSPHPAHPLHNRVISVLSHYGSRFKTFGENIILLLNRESETSLQLLILKLLYLLFTTPETYEYFYTNDLRVLVDVMIRNLLDLPLSSTALRHTYLRVLYPLLAHTQLRNPEAHYKRDELLKLLYMMTSDNGAGMLHFGAVDETTKRLVNRCCQVPWLKEAEDEHSASATPNRYLGIGVNAKAGESSLSMVEVAVHKEQPGVQTPSRGSMITPGPEETRRIRKDPPADIHVGNEVGNGVPLRSGGQGGGLADIKSPFEGDGEGEEV